MLVIFFTFIVFILIFFTGKIVSSIRFGRQVKTLFSLSQQNTEPPFSHQHLSGLPDPVQRYFKHVLKEGQRSISYARITHDGQFKTGLHKDWINIKGEQYASTEHPGFIWKGTTLMFTATDKYVAGKGRLTVSLFSLFTIEDAVGEQYNQGELLRWLGESILYPTNLLPGERLTWITVDFKTALLTFRYNGLHLQFIMRFNVIGQIIEMETKRYMDKNNLETWVIKISDYKEMNNVIIPFKFEVLWRLKTGDFSYAKFNIQKIEYDQPERFKIGERF